jgi:hypothetical protein
MPDKQQIYVVVQDGMVREVVGLPSHCQVTVLDYDVEVHEDERIQVSPLDGEACVINKF